MDRQQPTCPNCNQHLTSNTPTCPNCQASLAFAAVLTERLINQATQFPPASPPRLEVLVPRIGELLIQQGKIQPKDLDKALQIQKERVQSGQSILIGELLIELGFVSREALNQVITEHVFQLQSALALSHKRLEEQVEQQTNELQNALVQLASLNKLQLNFISNVSHELRMPMQFLLGYLDLLEKGLLGPLTEKQTHTVASMHNASQQLHRITEDLLQFSSFASSQILLDMTSFTLDGPVITAVSHTQPKAQAKNIQFQRQLPFLPQVIADNEKITWVVEQLLDNAIKFTPTGGQVKIETAPLKGDVLVQVIDTGIGIPNNRLNDLFAPIEKLKKNQSYYRREKGLGLTLAQKIVEAHGSSITVESYVGQGSCFSFTLPALN